VWEWLLAILSIVTIAVAFLFNIEQLVESSKNGYIKPDIMVNSNYCQSINGTSALVLTCQSDLTLAIVLALNICFVLYFALDGLFREQKYELLAFVLAILSTLLYVLINFIYQAVVTQRGDEPWRLARFIITFLLVPLNVVLAIVVFWKMGFLLFDSLGANPVLHKAYKWTRLLSSGVKLNFELLVSLFFLVVTRAPLFGTTSTPAPLAPHPAELAIVCILLLAAILGITLSTIGVYMENKYLSFVYLGIQLCTVVYYVFRVVWTSVTWSENLDTVNPNETFDATAVLALVTIILSAAGVVLTVAIFPVYIIVMRNYGKGLKNKLFG
jgi:hypothetical protein